MSMQLHQQLSLFAGMGLSLCHPIGQTAPAIPRSGLTLSERAALAARRQMASFSRLADTRESAAQAYVGGQRAAGPRALANDRSAGMLPARRTLIQPQP